MPYEIATARELNKLRLEIRDELAAKNIDATGEMSASLEVQGNKLIGNDYIRYIVNGRRPGKFPPLLNIEVWVRQKLGIKTKESEQIAFLIGRKISREGTEIFKNKSKGLELDILVDNMLENLKKEVADEIKTEILPWL